MLENNWPPIRVAKFDIGYLVTFDGDVLFRMVFNLYWHVGAPVYFEKLCTLERKQQWPGRRKRLKLSLF